MAKTRFARYLKTGDIVWHTTRKMWLRLTEVRTTVTDVGEHVAGWGKSLDTEDRFEYGIALGKPASLIIVRGEGGTA